MNIKDSAYKGHIAVFLANVIWGLNAPIGKAALQHISPLSLSTFRMTGAALSFLLLSLFLPREKVAPRDKVLFFFAGLFGVVINQGLFILGLSFTSPVNASIVTTTLPIVTMLLAAIILREPITGKKVVGVLLGASGALLLILGSGKVSLTGSVKGDLFCLLAQLSVAFYLTKFKKLFTRYSPFTVLTWMFSFASLCFVPFTWREVSAIPYASLSSVAFLQIAFVVFGGTFLAYIGFQIGQKFLRPTVVSMYNYIQPVIASSIAVWYGMDAFGWNKMIAIILVFSGVYFVTLSKSRAQIEEAKK